MSPKYEVPDDHWEKDEPEPVESDRTTVERHEIDVVYEVEPDHKHRDMGYGREKYTAKLVYDDDTGEPHVLYVIEHRWKGNYWRDITDWEFEDIPQAVRERVAAVLPVDGPEALDTDVRIMDEGGESRFKKYHKPRIEAHEGGENMWAESYLKEATEKLDGAAESLTDESTIAEVEDMVSDLQAIVRDLRGTPQEGQEHD